MTNHGRTNGPEGMRVVHETILRCYPDLNQEVVDMVSDGDKVVARLFTRGTHLGVPDGPIESSLFGGVLQGAAPTGRWMEIQAIHMWQLRDGMVIAHWANRDDVGMKKQLGL